LISLAFHAPTPAYDRLLGQRDLPRKALRDKGLLATGAAFARLQIAGDAPPGRVLPVIRPAREGEQIGEAT
jgi:hypothetical protein